MHTFTRLENHIFDHIPVIGALGLAVYAALCKRADNRSRQCWPSYETLARDAGMCRRSAKSKARQLADLGLIRIEPRQDNGQWSSPLFTVLDSLSSAPGVSATPPPGAADAPRTKPSQIELNPITTTTAPVKEVVVNLKLPTGISPRLACQALSSFPDHAEKQAILDAVAQARQIQTTPPRYLFGILKRWDSAGWQAEQAEAQAAQQRRELAQQTQAARLAQIRLASEQRAPRLPQCNTIKLREVLRL